MSKSRSKYVCDRCELPLQEFGGGWRHAVNSVTRDRACGPVPAPRLRSMPGLMKPGTPVVIWRPAGMVTVGHKPYRQKFAAGMADHLKGEVTVLRKDGKVICHMVLNRAEVASDGSGITYHYEVLAAAEAVAA